MIMIFDCETIPDTSLIQATMGEILKEQQIGDDELTLSFAAQSIHKERYGSEFLPIAYHQVVSIAAVFCDDYGRFLKVGNFPYFGNTKEEKEKTLIQAFLDYLNKHQPKLISYNGRNFDLPMLLLRAMKYQLQAHAYFEIENAQYNKNKWENYRQRYSERFHIDLLDSLSNYGSQRGLKLDAIANLIGFPGKYAANGICGENVIELYYQNKQDLIDQYCQSDVLNTYGIYLCYELLKGNLTLQDYQSILSNLSEKLPQDKGYYRSFFDKIQKQIKG